MSRRVALIAADWLKLYVDNNVKAKWEKFVVQKLSEVVLVMLLTGSSTVEVYSFQTQCKIPLLSALMILSQIWAYLGPNWNRRCTRELQHRNLKFSIGAGFRLEDLNLEGESGKILFWYDGVSEFYDCTIYATYCKLLLFIFQNILKSSESVTNIPRGLKIDFKWAETQIFKSWTFIYKTWPWTAVL